MSTRKGRASGQKRARGKHDGLAVNQQRRAPWNASAAQAKHYEELRQLKNQIHALTQKVSAVEVRNATLEASTQRLAGAMAARSIITDVRDLAGLPFGVLVAHGCTAAMVGLLNTAKRIEDGYATVRELNELAHAPAFSLATGKAAP